MAMTQWRLSSYRQYAYWEAERLKINDSPHMQATGHDFLSNPCKTRKEVGHPAAGDEGWATRLEVGERNVPCVPRFSPALFNLTQAEGQTLLHFPCTIPAWAESHIFLHRSKGIPAPIRKVPSKVGLPTT